jgi:hypothetical protein
VERIGRGIGLTFFFDQVAFGHGMETSLTALRKSQTCLNGPAAALNAPDGK